VSNCRMGSGAIALLALASAVSAQNKPDLNGKEEFGLDGLKGTKSVVFVISQANSMDRAGDFVKIALLRSVHRLTAAHRFTVVWNKHEDSYFMAKTLVPATDENRERLWKHILEVSFKGQTDPKVAVLDEVFKLKPELIVLVAARDLEPEAVEAITKKNTGKIPIRTFGIVLPNETDHKNLAKLAELNKGKFVTLKPPLDD